MRCVWEGRALREAQRGFEKSRHADRPREIADRSLILTQSGLSPRGVGVGIMVAHHPLHGSGRAGFPHPALASGDDAKPPQGIRMTDASRRQPAVDEPPHPVPGHAAVLTPSRQRPMPEPPDREPKSVERLLVHGHPVAPECPPTTELRMTRGRCGSLRLHRMTLLFTTPRRFGAAHKEKSLWPAKSQRRR